MPSFLGEYPWRTAWCGDIDITGHRRPQSYYREIIFGLRTDPYLAVQRPEHHGEVASGTPWTWSDAVSSWSWAGHEGGPVIVEVYADADEVELLVNGRSLGRQPSGAAHRYRSEFETVVRAGLLEAVAWRAGAEVGRSALRSASGPVLLDAQADRRVIAADPGDLAFVTLSLVDAGERSTAARIGGSRWESRGPACSRRSERQPGHRGGLHRPELHHVRGSCPRRGPADGRGADHAGRHRRGVCAARGRGRCPCRSRAGVGPGRDLGAALAPLPRPVGPLHVAPRRPPVDRRGRGTVRAEPPLPEDNALAPGGSRLRGSNPDYGGVYVFTNDLPVFSAEAPEPSPGDDLYRTRRALGTAEVVCYHHDPTRSLADLTDDEVTAIVTTWRARTQALQHEDGVAHVLVFENRGAAVGTSNPHPHCQIYAGSMVYATMDARPRWRPRTPGGPGARCWPTSSAARRPGRA